MTTPGLKADVMQLPPAGINAQAPNAWNGIPGSNDNVLFANNDLNNTWYLGFRNTIQIGGPNTIPVPPSGTVTLAANRTIYANAATGTTPLVVIPGGIAYFQGLTQGQGQLVLPSIRSPNFVHNVSGWTINKDGSAEFNNLLLRGTFTSTTVRISSNGIFLYVNPPGPQAGNVPIAGIATGTTDDFGNLFISGNMVTGGCMFFRNAAGAFTQLALFNSQPGLVNGTGDASEKHPAFHNTFVAGLSGTRREVTVVQSGDFDVSGVLNALINLISASQDGSTTPPELSMVVGGNTMLDIIGPLGINFGQITFGGIANQQMLWTDSNSQLNMPFGNSGPFLKGESFHTLTNPGGITGTVRVKLLPWNAIWYEGQVTNSGTTASTFTFGNPPSASYNPLTNLTRPVGTNASLSAIGNLPRLFIPTSGGPQLIVPAVTGANANYGWSLMIPSN